MKWVTRERPKTDRIACPWLIRKFTDPEAELLYVPPEQVLEVAERDGAHSYACRPRKPWSADRRTVQSPDPVRFQAIAHVPARRHGSSPAKTDEPDRWWRTTNCSPA
jgi:hypothetical protein